LYRPTDRQLLPFAGNFAVQSRSPVKGANDDYFAKKFFGGFFIDDDDSVTDHELSLLTSLAGTFADTITFVATTFREGNEILSRGRLSKLNSPFFYVLRSSNMSHYRWFVQGEDAHNLTYLEHFLSRVVAGSEKLSVLCSELPVQGPEVVVREVNALNDHERCGHRPSLRDGLVLTLQRLRPRLRCIAEVYNDQPLKFFWIDEPKNDLPPGFPELPGIPTLFLWQIGDRYREPVMFKGEYIIVHLAEWIAREGGLELTVPEFNQTETEGKLEQYRAPSVR
jgi:hypothetical protein